MDSICKTNNSPPYPTMPSSSSSSTELLAIYKDGTSEFMECSNDLAMQACLINLNEIKNKGKIYKIFKRLD